ncbi:uncharacterized protein [Temnothorax longispinosus]|uniref:uncharacterized protein n=1 Tax=Temnothorax longispinosus TaxID=300112 RepID=UPI003A99F028
MSENENPPAELNQSWLHSETSRRARRNRPLSPVQTTEEGVSDNRETVRRNLDEYYSSESESEPELHPNSVIEREQFDDSVIILDARVIGQNNCPDENRLHPSHAHAQSEDANSTTSKRTHRREFSLTSYDSSVFDPQEYYSAPRHVNVIEMAEATNSNHDANNVNDNAPITPEEIDEEINRLNLVLSQRGTPANHRNRIPARAGPPRDDRDSILDEILNGIRNLQDRVNQLETANPERREFHARREPSNLPFEVTYGRTSYDIRNQAERAIGYLRLKEARDMIPEFDGASSKLQEFLSAASYAIKNINPMEEGTLLEAVLCTKLKGRAMIDFQTREIRDFAQLKKELEVCYLSRKSTTHLQLEFNTLKQKPGENARAFGLRADKLAMELYDSMIEGRNHTIESKRTILETIQQQALQNFQLGLRDEIKLLVRAQHFATLQEAIAGASAEEKVNGPSGIPPRPKNNYAYSPQPRDNRSILQCQKCGKYGHLGRECRTNRYANRFSLPKPDRTPRVNAIDKVCNYCKKAGHMREECWLLNGRPNKERTNHNKPNNPRGQNKNFHPKTNGPRKKDSNSAANSDEKDKEDTKQRRPALEYQVSHLTNKPRKHAGLDLITLPMREAKREKINLLFDTGAAVSIIKVKHLKGETMIEEDKMALTGVTGHKAHTIGKFTATIDLKDRKIKHTIYVVKDDFPIEY